MSNKFWTRAACIAPGLMFLTLLTPGATLAAAPQVKTQAPGYYRTMLGDFEITVLLDGVYKAETMLKLLSGITQAQYEKALEQAFVKPPLHISNNGYLINTGSKLVLVDAGNGAPPNDPDPGVLMANLRAAGYKPEQVDEIYITHMHFDHVGGLVDGTQRAFPNAVVRASKRDADFWLSDANMNAAPAEAKELFKAAMESMKPYIAAGKFKPFEGDAELVPGIKAVPAYGHTPGHTLYAVESKGQKLMLWGDLLHVAEIQFPNPAVTISYDTDQKAAAPARKKFFAEAAKGGYWIAGTHMSFPAIGHLRSNGNGYEWMPAPYSTCK